MVERRAGGVDVEEQRRKKEKGFNLGNGLLRGSYCKPDSTLYLYPMPWGQRTCANPVHLTVSFKLEAQEHHSDKGIRKRSRVETNFACCRRNKRTLHTS